MKQNMGVTDRVIRSLTAMAIGILMNLDVFSGTIMSIILGIAAALLLCTSFTGVCLFYIPFHFSTTDYSMTPKIR